MKIFALLICLISLTAQAEFLKDLCQKTPFGLSYQGSMIANGKVIWNQEGTQLLKDEEGFLGYAQVADNFWLLKQDVLQEVSTEGEILTEITLPELSVMGWGKKIFLLGDEMYIVRGSGLSRFDTKNKNFIWSVKLSDSGSTLLSGATDGTHLYVLHGTTMPAGFIGVSQLNREGEEINKLALNRPRSGVFADGAIAHWYQDRLLVNNGGWMISFDQKQLMGKKALISKLIPTPIQLPEGKKQVMMRGDFLINENGFTGCGSYNQLIEGQGRINNDLFSFGL